MKTNKTKQDIANMADSEIIKIAKDFMFPSQWENEDALSLLQYRLAMIQGNRYVKTGNINSFKWSR